MFNLKLTFEHRQQSHICDQHQGFLWMSQSSQAQADSWIPPHLPFPHSFPATPSFRWLRPHPQNPPRDSSPTLPIQLTPQLHLPYIWNPTTSLLHGPHLVQVKPPPLAGNKYGSIVVCLPVHPCVSLQLPACTVTRVGMPQPKSELTPSPQPCRATHLTNSTWSMSPKAPPPPFASPTGWLPRPGLPTHFSLCLDSLLSDINGSFCTQMALSFGSLPCDLFYKWQNVPAFPLPFLG